MGNAQASVTADMLVTKEEATSAVLTAFKGASSGHKVSIKEIASSLPFGDTSQTMATQAPAENPQWRTSYQMMTTSRAHATTLKGSAGMVIGGPPPSSARGGSLSWRKVVDSATLSRDERMRRIRAMFTALDDDRNSVVTRDEFVQDLQADGIEAKDAAALFKDLDESRTGHLTLAKFDHYVAVHTLSMVRDTFHKLDVSHDRQLTQKEFVQYFLGNGLSARQAKTLWGHMDVNGNGKINFVEYRDWAKDALTTRSLDETAISLGLS